MTPETITRILQTPIDFSAPGAAMQLAWNKVASDKWSRRDFTPPTSEHYSRALRFAWKTVRQNREWARLQALADQDPDIHRLRVERSQLYNKSFHVSIKDDLDRIDREIYTRTRALA